MDAHQGPGGTSLEAGQRLGDRYALVEPVATGDPAWASWVATDLKFGVRVHLRVSARPDDRARAAWAARVVQRLARTAGVVRGLDWGEGAGVVFQALDLVPGGRPLDLSGGPTPERLGLLAEAAAVVAEVHKLGVCHLDLCPARVVVAREGGVDGVHLLGFEAARCRDLGEAPPLPPPVAPALAAPEQARGEPGPAADVFTLGAMLHQPCSASRPASTRRRQRSGGWPTLAPRPRARRRTGRPRRRLVRGLRRAAAAPRPTAPPRPLPALPQEGFVGWEEVRRVAAAHGAEAVVEALGRVPLLLARRERPLGGRTTFLGRFVAVRGPSVTLGRAPEADLRLDLPSISSRHLQLARAPDGLTVTDASSNGTWIDGAPLPRGEPRLVRDRQVIGLADHVWLELLLPATATALLQPAAARLTFEAG
ncbi:MAG: FHA domain-containing protein [Planctomycetes bacterium]|nr:FHA domain-containing protein [Planctomycetota bacterium]